MIRISLLSLALVAATAPAVAQSSTILPGYWESRSSVLFVDQKPALRCITPAQVEEYISGPSNRHYTCTYAHRQIGDGKLSMSGTCVDHRGRRSQVGIKGEYTPSEFHVRWSFRARFAGMPLPVSGTMDARRLSEACPAGAK